MTGGFFKDSYSLQLGRKGVARIDYLAIWLCMGSNCIMLKGEGNFVTSFSAKRSGLMGKSFVSKTGIIQQWLWSFALVQYILYCALTLYARVSKLIPELRVDSGYNVLL